MNELPDYPREVSRIYQSRRDALCDGLERAGWSFPKPKGTMFVWAPIPEQYARSGRSSSPRSSHGRRASPSHRHRLRRRRRRLRALRARRERAADRPGRARDQEAAGRATADSAAQVRVVAPHPVVAHGREDIEHDGVLDRLDRVRDLARDENALAGRDDLLLVADDEPQASLRARSRPARARGGGSERSRPRSGGCGRSSSSRCAGAAGRGAASAPRRAPRASASRA